MKKKKNFIDSICERKIKEGYKSNCMKYGFSSFSGSPGKSTFALQQLIKLLKI